MTFTEERAVQHNKESKPGRLRIEGLPNKHQKLAHLGLTRMKRHEYRIRPLFCSPLSPPQLYDRHRHDYVLAKDDLKQKKIRKGINFEFEPLCCLGLYQGRIEKNG